MAQWYDVTGVYAGAVDDQRLAGDEQQADAIVSELKRRYSDSSAGDDFEAGDGETWAIYVTPHYCDPDDADDECVCAQYLTDHHPAYSSEQI